MNISHAQAPDPKRADYADHTALPEWSGLAARAHDSVPLIYGLTVTLTLGYVAALAWSAATTATETRGLGSALHAFRVGNATQILLWSATIMTLIYVLMRRFNHAGWVLLGLLLFALNGSREALDWGVRAGLLLPLGGYFAWRARSESPARSLALLVASITALHLARLESGLLGVGMSQAPGSWLTWSWTLIACVFCVNLALAWWHVRPIPIPAASAWVTDAATVPSAPTLSAREIVTVPAATPSLTPVVHQRPTYQNAAVRARFTLTDVIGMEPIKGRLLEAGRDAMIGTGSTNGILLFGAPGNGKTFLAEALAGELQLLMISANFGTFASRFVYQTTERAMQVFDDAVSQAPCLLFIDEIEAMLGDRSASADGAGEYSRTTAALLTRLVDIRTQGVVLVAATNYLDRMDPAAIREGRFDTKVEITAPDDAARQALIRQSVMEAAHHFVWPAADTVAALSRHWDGFSVSRIRAVARIAGRRASDGGVEDVPVEAFQQALRDVQGTFGDYVPGNALGLEALHFDGEVGAHLTDLADSMRQSFAFERHGGRLAGGVLFYGPPRTGKTMAAKALAQSTGWAMVYSNGTELARHPDRIRSVIQRAVDLKPCIVFIDEADALIADRSRNWNAAATNAFLAEIGDDRASLRDVLFIAATNHPAGADAAMLRGGRFGEHLEFSLPTRSTILAFLHAEMQARPLTALADVLERASAAMVGLPLSDVKSALDRACNTAARRAMSEALTGSKGGSAVLIETDF